MLDELDHRLIALLRADSRCPAQTLAARLGVSRATVQNRITRLTTRGIIQAFTIRTVPEMEAQRVRAVMSIAIEGERSNEVARKLHGLPQVACIHTTNGRWDFVVELDAASLSEFSDCLDAIRLIGGIANSETSLLLSTKKL